MEDRIVSELIESTKGGEMNLRLDAIDALVLHARDGNNLAIDRLFELTEDPEPEVSSKAKGALGRILPGLG